MLVRLDGVVFQSLVPQQCVDRKIFEGPETSIVGNDYKEMKYP